MGPNDKLILERLRQEIRRNDRPVNRRNYQRFYKEKLAEPISIKTDILRNISDRSFRECRGMTATETLQLCDKLLSSNERYMRFVAFEWAAKIQGKYARSDFARFQRWLSKYVDNWGACDHLCCGALGQIVLQYPELAPRTRRWARSRNRWMRRAAAVSLIVSLRDRLEFAEGAATADLLLSDQDDMVRKACGWMLKEASKNHPRQVFEYVIKNSPKMSRTTLRYAIERLPAGLRKRALAAGK